MLFSTRQTHPLLARKNRAMAIAGTSAAIACLLAAGTLAVSAQTSTQPRGQQMAAAAMPAAISPLPAAATATAPQSRRQVRVIPIFNTPPNQTGFTGK